MYIHVTDFRHEFEHTSVGSSPSSRKDSDTTDVHVHARTHTGRSWRIEEPGGLQCVWSQRVGLNLATEQQQY